MLLDFLGSLLIIASSLLDVLNMRARLPFSGVMLIVEFTKSMSVNFRFQASPIRKSVCKGRFDGTRR
jgi:hypothetical protein